VAVRRLPLHEAVERVRSCLSSATQIGHQQEDVTAPEGLA
jgi:hypothetical protein